MKALFEKFRNDQEFYDEFLNYYEGSEENARGWFDHYFDKFNERLSKLSVSDGGVKVWRVINCIDLQGINLEKIGASWSYTREAAHCWYGGEGQSFLIETMVSLDNIDLETTLRQNLVNPDEEKFRLEEHCEVSILRVYDEDGKLVQEFSEPLTSSSGRLGAFGDWHN